MIQLFQDPTVVMHKGFEIDPTNVVQFVVGGLVFILIVMGYIVSKLWTRLMDREKRLEELTVNITTVAVNSTSVLEVLSRNIDDIPRVVETHKVEIKTAIKDAEAALQRAIDQVNKK